MSGSKPVYTSKTVGGIILMVVPVLLSLFGVEFTGEDTQALQLLIDTVTPLVGAAVALYGRMVAKDNLTV
jgi:uncharacterized membrane protein YqjE